jgi:periplasmic divalent cation tolerance protein
MAHLAPQAVVAAYLTFPDSATAEALASALVDARLAACVNVLPQAMSVYRWDGAVVRAPEVVAVAKTTAGRMTALVAMVEAHHPYDVPCVVAYPAADGLPAFLDWVRAEVDG